MFVSCWALAQTGTYETYDYNQNVADLGRGGLHEISPTNGASMLANPAILGFVRGFHSVPLSLQLGANGQQTLTNLQTNPPSQSNLNSYFGQNIWVGADAYSTFEFPFFGFALYGTSYADLWASNPAYPSLNIETLEDLAYVVGFGVPVSKEIAIGMNFKRITRYGAIVTVGPSSLVTENTSQIQSQIQSAAGGTGYGIDLGLLYRGESSIHPTFSVDWKDAGWVTFTPNASGGTAPPQLEDNLNVAVEFSQNYLGVGWLAGAEFRHLINWNIDSSKKINFGAELDLGLLDARCGLYEGYFTYGTSVDLWILTIDAAEYTIERGIYAGQSSDARIQLGLRIEAGLDPDFNFVSFGGKHRHLKQRR